MTSLWLFHRLPQDSFPLFWIGRLDIAQVYLVVFTGPSRPRLDERLQAFDRRPFFRERPDVKRLSA
jgi:hypothetical protein